MSLLAIGLRRHERCRGRVSIGLAHVAGQQGANAEILCLG
jgi:hypothetical protein